MVAAASSLTDLVLGAATAYMIMFMWNAREME